MNKNQSCFLDLLRIIAAGAVLICHAYNFWTGQPPPISGHHFVVLFFVMSGYLITYSAMKPSMTGRVYTLARLSRLYSVVLPALALTALLALACKVMTASAFAEFDRGHEFIRLALSSLFLQEIWFFSAAPPSNGPFWSLAYEAWYYVLLGVWLFIPRKRARWIVAGLVILVAGPKIMLLLPVWLIGVVVLRTQRFANNFPVARFTFIISLMAIVIIVITDWQYPKTMATAPWFFSSWFVSDYILGILTGGLIWSGLPVVGQLQLPNNLYKWVQRIASFTFSLYLFHYPMLIFGKCVLQMDQRPLLVKVFALILLVVVCAGLAQFTENKRPWLHSQLERLLRLFNNRIAFRGERPRT